MSCIDNSSNSVYTQYVNPVYVTAITSPAFVPTLVPLSPSKRLSTFRSSDDCSSHTSSCRSRRHRMEFPYVIRRGTVSGHQPAATNGISSITKSLRKLKFSHISNDLISEPHAVSLQSQAVYRGTHAGDCSRPSSHDDPEMSRSFLDLQMSVLNIGDVSSSVNGEKNLE